MATANRDQIIKFLKAKSGRSYRRKELARQLDISDRQYPSFRRLINQLVREGILVRLSGGRLAYAGPASEVQGTMEVTFRGFGFVSVEGMDDVFVEARDLGGAVTGDLVKLTIRKQSFGRGPKGRVTEVIKRGRSTLVGRVERVAGGFELDLSTPLANRAIRLKPSRIKKTEIGSLAYARVTDWGSGNHPIQAEIVEIIGSPDDPLTDFRHVLHQFELNPDFPQTVEEEVAQIASRIIIGPEPGRRDLRALTVATIDPATAKDFDDAISLESLTDGGWRLGVHIADVSLFVPPGSAVDSEAFHRANSVYFTEGVVPMLPHLLSSDLCSLMPEKDRFALSVLIKLSSTGQVEAVEFVRSLICSDRRFTYSEVHDILEAGSGKWYPFLSDLKALTQQFYKDRVEQGSVDFDIPEPLFKLDEYGIPHIIRPSERLDSHRIVEECMLLANRLVAEYISKGKRSRASLYRIHEEPSQDQIERLSVLLRHLKLPGLPTRNITSRDVRDLLLTMEDSPHRDLIETLTLRTMAKAVYSTTNKGHFGLAFSKYTHFTSPIRRYADLVIHRLVVAYLLAPHSTESFTRSTLDRVASQCTHGEIVALEAERTYSRLKELRFLATRIGDTFDGMISGVIPKGMFVQIREFLVDGFVNIDWLGDDDYYFDERTYALRGRRFNRAFQLGQELRVKVRDVSIEKQFADFQVVE